MSTDRANVIDLVGEPDIAKGQYIITAVAVPSDQKKRHREDEAYIMLSIASSGEDGEVGVLSFVRLLKESKITPEVRALLDELKNTHNLMEVSHRAIQFVVAKLPKLAWMIEPFEDFDDDSDPEWDITVDSYKQLEHPVAISEIICVCHCEGEF